MSPPADHSVTAALPDVRGRTNFDRMVAFAQTLPCIPRAVARDLRLPALARRTFTVPVGYWSPAARAWSPPSPGNDDPHQERLVFRAHPC